MNLGDSNILKFSSRASSKWYTMVSWQEEKAHGSQEKQMQATDPKKLASKLMLDKIEKQTRSAKGGGYVFGKPSKGKPEAKPEEDYSKYIK